MMQYEEVKKSKGQKVREVKRKNLEEENYEYRVTNMN